MLQLAYLAGLCCRGFFEAFFLDMQSVLLLITILFEALHLLPPPPPPLEVLYFIQTVGQGWLAGQSCIPGDNLGKSHTFI